MYKFFFLSLSIYTLFFSACSHVETNPKVLKLECELDSSILDHSNVITVSKEGHRLFKGDMEVEYPYQVSSRGCIIIPKNSDYDLVIKSDKHGKRLKVKNIPEGFNLNFVELDEFQTNFQIFSYCGFEPQDSNMVVKILDSHNLPHEEVTYETKYGDFHTAKVNNQGCIEVPKIPGRILANDKTYITLRRVNDFITVEKEKSNFDNFLTVCKREGKNDPIINAFSKIYPDESESCDDLYAKARLHKKLGTELYLAGIKDISALRGLDNLEVLNLIDNNITDISPLKELKKLNLLALAGNDILFFDNVPSSIKQFVAGPSLGSLKSMKHVEGLEQIAIGSSDLRDLNDFSLFAKTLYAISARELRNVKNEKIDGEFKNLHHLKINLNPSFAKALTDGLNAPLLRDVYAEECKISDISWVKNHPNIKTLDLKWNNLVRVDELGDLEHLHTLILDRNPIKFTPNLSSLRNLEIIKMRSCQITSIEGLLADNVKDLSIQASPIKDLSLLRNNTSITFLDARECPLVNCPEDSSSIGVQAFCKNWNKENT